MSNIKDERELISKPGDTILETLEHMHMTQTELAARMGKTAPKVNDIISGKEPITLATALLLEKVFGIDAHFWLNREIQYREKLLRIEQEEFLEECLGWLEQQPIKELKKLGYLNTEKKGTALVDDMLRFYGVATPVEWKNVYVQNYSSAHFRKSAAHPTTLASIAAWLRIGEIEFRKMNVPDYNKEAFRKCLESAREIARTHPEDFASRLKNLCQISGIALIYSRCLPHAPVSGATRWIGGRPVIQITDRYKTNDHFWFTFYHEAGHICLHGKKEVFLEQFDGYENDEQKEEEANRFATEWLLPDSLTNNLPEKITDNDIKDLARRAGTHPGIVVGRLQKLGKLPYYAGEDFKFKINLQYFINKT
ncbi:MAG: HigA family addiction module antidote protein [Bacteroidetes bacterium]|nr:HigA family addiction module antidote protein [Bacteroidota bacterium]